MKKAAIFGSAMAAVIVASTMSMTAFAASNPADDATSYSFNDGEQSYQSRMAEGHDWFDNEDQATIAGYSFNTGAESASTRNNTFAGMPGDDATKEQVESWFEAQGLGEGSAWLNGQYSDSAKNGYGYSEGQSAYQQRHASFAEEN